MNFRIISKIGLFLAILTVALMAVFALQSKEVFAYYDDSESSSDNSLTAGALDFYLSSAQDFNPEMTCSSATRTIDLLNNNNPFRYKIETTEISGDLCNYIILEANLDGGASECQGNLIGFNCEEFLFPMPNGTDSQQWNFEAFLTEGAPEESVCTFKFLYSGWQVNLEGGGFHDEEEIENTITSGICLPESPKVVINKVYYDVDSEHGEEETNEWIELYNPNPAPIDISDWRIEDNQQEIIIPNSNPIPAYGFALITGDNSTWNYWENIPDSVLKIVLPEGKIGNGLDNDGDRVILKDSFERIIDQMSYEQDTSVFDPAPPLDSGGNTYNLPEGHILGRNPTGYDTDSVSDWKDFGLPQVTVTYPTGGTWYCNQNVTIKYTATNLNGLDSDLSITILYIRDLDKNGFISGGDAITTIAQDIANTGTYNWQLSPCYYGYVWIRVIAFGPENFMLSDSGLSGRVFEPPTPSESNGIVEVKPQPVPETEQLVVEEISVIEEPVIIEQPEVEETILEEIEEELPVIDESVIIEETIVDETVIDEVTENTEDIENIVEEEIIEVIDQEPEPEPEPEPEQIEIIEEIFEYDETL